jgi:hypothetical protein
VKHGVEAVMTSAVCPKRFKGSQGDIVDPRNSATSEPAMQNPDGLVFGIG